VDRIGLDWSAVVHSFLDPKKREIHFQGGCQLSLAVDVGCGSGQASAMLADGGFARVVALDASQSQIDRAKETVRRENLQFRVSSAESMPFLSSGGTDLVCAVTSVHWFALEAFLEEVVRVLRPGGALAVLWTRRLKALEVSGDEAVSEAISAFNEQLKAYEGERDYRGHQEEAYRRDFVDVKR